jgi:hypothetical protein
LVSLTTICFFFVVVVGLSQQYLHSLCEGANEWPNAQLSTDSRSAPAVAAGAQGVLDDNVEQLSRLLMSQYEGLSLADVNRGTTHRPHVPTQHNTMLRVD